MIFEEVIEIVDGNKEVFYFKETHEFGTCFWRIENSKVYCKILSSNTPLTSNTDYGWSEIDESIDDLKTKNLIKYMDFGEFERIEEEDVFLELL